tara:strand:- start:1207 stop:1389 length:183 start_codon:yes stop_codon:yes gene_type:complete
MDLGGEEVLAKQETLADMKSFNFNRLMPVHDNSDGKYEINISMTLRGWPDLMFQPAAMLL